MPNSDYRLVYTDDNGQVVIVSPVDNCGLTLEAIKDKDCPKDKTDLTLDQIKDKDCPSGKTVYTVNKSAIPTDRGFRNAWTYTE